MDETNNPEQTESTNPEQDETGPKTSRQVLDEDIAWLNENANPRKPDTPKEDIRETAKDAQEEAEPLEKPATTDEKAIPKRAEKKTTPKKKPVQRIGKKQPQKPIPSKPRKSSQPKKSILPIIIAIALLIILIIEAVILFGPGKKGPGILPPAEKKISIFTIDPTACPECSLPPTVLSAIQTLKGDEATISLDDAKAKGLIAAYQITKLPAVVIQGTNETPPGFIAQGDGFIYEPTIPPYVDSKNAVIGRVSATLLVDSSCPECFDIGLILSQFKQAGIDIAENFTMDISTTSGKILADRYNITKVPTIILSKEAGAYPFIAQNWGLVGSVESDRSYILRNVSPPYVNRITHNVEGLVQLTYITDASCTACYNVSIHYDVLAGRLGMSIKRQDTYDIKSAEGKALIATYKIEKVPTVIVSKDAGTYPFFMQVWQVLGSQEPDGNYVFRNFEALQGEAYRDLATGKIVTNSTVNPA